MRHELIALLSKRGRLAEAEIELLQLPTDDENTGRSNTSAVISLTMPGHHAQLPMAKRQSNRRSKVREQR